MEKSIYSKVGVHICLATKEKVKKVTVLFIIISLVTSIFKMSLYNTF